MSRARELGRFAGTITASGDLSFADNTGILDSNDNEIILFQEAASAVNYLNIGNHSTGNAPYVTAGGSDTNVDLVLGAKGTGAIKPSSTIEITGVTEPIWFSEIGNGNGILFDDQKQKRITWNDGNGNFTIRSGVYYNSGEKYVVGGDGASKITFTSDTAQGSLAFGVAGIGTNADDLVTYTHTLFMNASGTFTYDNYRIHNEGDEGAWIAMTFQNNWANFAGWAPGSYRKAADGRIDIRGMIYHISGTNIGVANKICTLPEGYRTGGHVMFATTTYAGTATQLWIDASGQVYFGVTGAATGSSNWHNITCSYYP